MQKKKILSLAIATATIVTGLVGVTTAYDSLDVLDNGDLKVCGTEYISDSNGSGGCITIQGKNVGATTTGAGRDALSTSYGDYYQWGDNTVYTTSNWNSSNIQPNNAWGGGSDNNGLVYPVENESERQGPCDPGYHVPSKGEWYALMDMWADSSVNGYIGSNISQFYTAFQIPFAGSRGYYDGSLGYQGDLAYLWSSSPYVGDDYARYFYMGEFGAYADYSLYRTLGFPVRCFKNSALGSSSSEGGDGSGGNSKIIVSIAALNSGQNTCSGEDFIFPAITAKPSQQVIILAKKFQCIFGSSASKAVTLALSGDLTDSNGNVISGENVRLSNPEWTEQPAGLKVGNTVFSKQTFLGQGKTLFNKTGNKIGTANGSGVEIEITVPGGTPDGIYNGTLVLTY